jgi:hypothetical protein
LLDVAIEKIAPTAEPMTTDADTVVPPKVTPLTSDTGAWFLGPDISIWMIVLYRVAADHVPVTTFDALPVMLWQ